MAAIVSSLIAGEPWPVADATPAALDPARFAWQPA
jgi:hypothetical protein